MSRPATSPAAGASAPATTAADPPPTAAPATTTTTIGPLPADDGSLAPTTDRPPTSGPELAAEGQLLLQAISTGAAATALPMFLPEAAYVQIKALPDDDADWTERLVGHLDLDVAAAHALLGPGATGATFVALDVPAAHVRWIPPRACANRLGYWYVGGSRLVYAVGGEERSIGIAALDSWRGSWYLVHLGSETPPAGRGVVDAPAAGVGGFGSAAGC